MFQRSYATPILILFIAMSYAHIGIGQENIQDQFNQFYEKETSTWEEYKLIKQPKLRGFWKVVSDTLKIKNDLISESKLKVRKLRVHIDTLNNQVSSLESNLEKSETVNDQIFFIGLPMAKAAYNVMVWLIILILGVAVGVVYMMYMRSNSVTKKIQKAYSSLENEYTDHKNRSRENQVKLKRELQTALNTLHENRIN